MPSFEYDAGYLEAANELLEDYLLSKEIYWKLNASSPPGEPGYPSLTLGAMLLAAERLQARQLTPDQSQEFSRLHGDMERKRSKWRTCGVITWRIFVGILKEISTATDMK
jgi:hypothetical protein